MSSDRAKLEATLEELRSVLEHASVLEPTAAERMHRLIVEAEALVAEPQTANQPGTARHSLRQRLHEATRDFETAHPTLAGAVGSVIDALAQMGI